MNSKLRLTAPVLIWGSAALFYFYQFIVRAFPSVTVGQMMQEFSLQACGVGMLASWYYYGYTTMQIPVGLILDRVGVRYPLTLAVLSCAMGCFMYASTDSLMVMGIGRTLMGVGAAFAFLSCVKSASDWFDAKYLPAFIGWSIFMGPLGGAIGNGRPMANLVIAQGWRNAVLLIAVSGLFVALLSWLFVRDHPQIQVRKIKQTSFSIFEAIIVILKNPQTYLFGLYGGLMYVPLAGFADLWGAPYIEATYHVDKVTAAGSVSLFYVGIGIGGPLSAWVLASVQSYKKLLFWGAIMTGLMFSLIIYVPVPAFYPLLNLPAGVTLSLIDLMFLTTGVFASVQFAAFACVCAINPQSISGTASGVHNMACMMSGIIFQPLIGKLLEWAWDGTVENSAPVYSEADYFFALSSIPLSLVFAALVILMVKELYPKELPKSRG
ncbi:MAG: MFS transporter [Pseudomonadota bacterium]